jgi:regulatory protein
VLGTDEALQRALEISYAYLNRRDRTVSEISLQLERKGLGAELIEVTVRTLVDQGFLDDARYARLFVADKRELEQWGSERLRRGLLARGIERELADAALVPPGAGATLVPPGAGAALVPPGAGAALAPAGDQAPEPTELDRALALLHRRYPVPPADRRERERALGMLLRKGYESELALVALRAYARAD